MARISANEITSERRTLGEWGARTSRRAFYFGMAVLLITFVVGLVLDDLRRFCAAYLINFAYVLSLALAALFFVSLQHVTRAGWSVVVRRLGEIIAASLPWLGLMAIPVVLSVGILYEWTRPGDTSHAELIDGKTPYLNVPFFVLRVTAYFLIWSVLSRALLGRSLRQDASGDPDITLGLAKLGGLSIVLFALTITFAAFDLLMSLTPTWYSTIYGVYYFAGGMVAFMALLSLVSMGLQWRGLLTRTVTREHYHDLGKLLFGFVFFWGYIAFSQYMLIWYGNIPEETAYYLVRQQHPWLMVTLALLVGHFFIPFMGLMPRRVKRRKITLAAWSAWLLVIHWVDMLWLVAPTFSPDKITVGVLEIGCLLGVGGLFVAAVLRVAADRSLVPERDPRLAESLEFENA